MSTQTIKAPQIQTQINPNEDVVVFSVFVERNVGATKIEEVETINDKGKAVVQEQEVDASSLDADGVQALTTALEESAQKLGFNIRVNSSQTRVELAENEIAKLTVDVAYQKRERVVEPEPELEPEFVPTDDVIDIEAEIPENE